MNSSNYISVVTAFLAITALTSCSSEARENSNANIQVVPPSEIAAEQDATALRQQRFQKALELSAIYSSEIRSELINNPESHRASYREGSGAFRNLPHQFRCPHDATTIERISAVGWQIVKCEIDKVTFFRRHAEAQDEVRRCFAGAGRKMKDIGDEFETLTIWFPTFAPAAEQKGEDKIMKGLLDGVSLYLSGEEVKGDVSKSLKPLGKFRDAPIFHKSWGHFDRYYALDEHRKRLVQFDVQQGPDCKRNPIGWVNKGHIHFSLDSPQTSIAAMDEVLSGLVSLYENNKNLAKADH